VPSRLSAPRTLVVSPRADGAQNTTFPSPEIVGRIMFQIPAGFPGLSGLYVVAYIKIADAPTKQYL
jgi:hypothetical protein